MTYLGEKEVRLVGIDKIITKADAYRIGRKCSLVGIDKIITKADTYRIGKK